MRHPQFLRGLRAKSAGPRPDEQIKTFKGKSKTCRASAWPSHLERSSSLIKSSQTAAHRRCQAIAKGPFLFLNQLQIETCPAPLASARGCVIGDQVLFFVQNFARRYSLISSPRQAKSASQELKKWTSRARRA